MVIVNKDQIKKARELYNKHFCNSEAYAKCTAFVERAREGTRPLLEEIRMSEQITAADRMVYINI